MTSPRSDTPSPDERPLLHGVDWAAQAGVADEVMLGTRRHVRRRRQKRLTFLGAVGMLALGASLWFSSSFRPNMAPVAASAVVSVPDREILPDGSVVQLKEGARIAVAYTPGVRRVVLQRGEAHFEVVHDRERPFIVAVDAVEVRAVGTAFSVERHSTQVEVLVTTGRVAVDRVAESPAGPAATIPQTIALLDAGNCAVVEVAATPAVPAIEPLSVAEIGQRLAWRQPRLEFTRTPLSEAIPMINQHSAIKLSLADPALGEVRISGLLRIDNIDALFQLLEAEHGVTVERRSAEAVVLRSGR